MGDSDLSGSPVNDPLDVFGTDQNHATLRQRGMKRASARQPKQMLISRMVECSGVGCTSPLPPGGGGGGSMSPDPPPTKWPVTSDPWMLKPATCMAKYTEPSEGGDDLPLPFDPSVKCPSVAFPPRPLISTVTGLGRVPPLASPDNSQAKLPNPDMV